MRQQSIPSVTQNQAMAVSCCPSTKTCSFLRRSKVCSPSRSPHTQRSPHTHKIAGERGIFHQDSIFSTSSCSVDRYQLRKYPYCRISNTPSFGGVLTKMQGCISCARMEFSLRRIMVILDGIFGYSMTKRLAKAQPPRTPPEFDHDIHTLPQRPGFHHNSVILTTKLKGDAANDLSLFNACRQSKITAISYPQAFLYK